MAFRFANTLFEPVWNRNFIDHVEITAAEDIGIGGRAGYYDHAGALRDLVQNHMLQLLSLLTMEPPSSFDADRVRDEKVKVLEADRSAGPGPGAHRWRCEASTAPGRSAARRFPATGRRRASPTTREPRPTPRSACTSPTGAGPEFPFYLRTGKRLPAG